MKIIRGTKILYEQSQSWTRISTINTDRKKYPTKVHYTNYVHKKLSYPYLLNVQHETEHTFSILGCFLKSRHTKNLHCFYFLGQPYPCL